MSSPSCSPIQTARPAGAAPGLRALLVGTYPPTECGIATYTANVRWALEGAGVEVDVVRLLDPDAPRPSPAEVVAVWQRGRSPADGDALRAAGRVDAVIVQHEFGIYPGPDGQDVVDFVAACSRPVLTVLHTVLHDPTPRQRVILDALADRSDRLIVHSKAARRRLLAVQHVDPTRVAVIPHGAAPNLLGDPLVASREPILLTWGLLGPGKGIEHGIEAVAALRERGVEVRYVVAGGTHPNVRARHGERYRDGLQKLATRRGVADLVDFDDAYRDWASLHSLVRSARIVLVPYDSEDQVTSGVLVEALAAGKPVVSTAFPHAVELRSTGAVMVVPHRSPSAIADAVRRIHGDPHVHDRMAAAARAEGARYDWSAIGRQLRSQLLDIVDEHDGVIAIDAAG